jgi:hypothetical protein
VRDERHVCRGREPGKAVEVVVWQRILEVAQVIPAPECCESRERLLDIPGGIRIGGDFHVWPDGPAPPETRDVALAVRRADLHLQGRKPRATKRRASATARRRRGEVEQTAVVAARGARTALRE